MNEYSPILPGNVPPPPPSSAGETWLNALSLTPDQLANTYAAFPGGNKSEVVSLLFTAMDKIAEARRQAGEERVRAEEYRHLAETDQLTGIGSRHSKDSWNAEYYKPAENGYMAIAFDLKHFKSLNDQFGHGAGDAALVLFASKLLKTFRFRPKHGPSDDRRQQYFSEDGLFLRPGGDEFVVVLTMADDYDVEKISEIMETKIDEMLAIGYEELSEYIDEEMKDGFVPVMSRYGFAFADTDTSLDELMAEADMEAKQQPTSR